MDKVTTGARCYILQKYIHFVLTICKSVHIRKWKIYMTILNIHIDSSYDKTFSLRL